MECWWQSRWRENSMQCRWTTSRLSICVLWDKEISPKDPINSLPGNTRRRQTLLTLCSAQHDRVVEDDRRRDTGDESLSVRPKRVPWNKGLKMIPGQSKNRSTEEQLKVEELRRQRISAANKGRLPWNTGRKHPPETIKRIKERTLEAMKDPKIREKLRGFQQSLSADVKAKISIAVHEHWVRKLKEIALEKQCLSEWQNCVAEAARLGAENEEELQWDSYAAEKQRERDEAKKLKEEMRIAFKSQKKLEWSDEHRRKVSEAIRAKWQSQEYRTKVMAALKVRVGNSTKPKKPPKPAKPQKPRKPAQIQVSHRRTVRIDEKFVSAVMAGEEKAVVSVLPKKRVKVNGVAHPKLKATTEKNKQQSPLVPTFVDARASEKTEKLRQLRASRLVVDAKKTEAAERAKMLMAEAEAAAKALEAIAFKDQFAMASLLETRKLLAEAAQSIKSVEGNSVELKKVAQLQPDDQRGESEDHSSKVATGSIDEQHITKNDELTCTEVDIKEETTLQELPRGSAKRTKRWHCGRLVFADEPLE